MSNWRSRQQARTLIRGSNGTIAVTRNRRTVRLTAMTRVEDPTGVPVTATHAFVDLDEAALDRLVRRLRAVRGGKVALR